MNRIAAFTICRYCTIDGDIMISSISKQNTCPQRTITVDFRTFRHGDFILYAIHTDAHCSKTIRPNISALRYVVVGAENMQTDAHS